MLVVQLFAGIGNQMFQYAFYKSFEADHKDVRIDENSFRPSWDIEKTKLSDVFPNVEYSQAPAELIGVLGDFNRSRIHRIRRRFLYTKTTHIREPKFTYNEFIRHLQGDYYLEGFWQSEKYFHNIRPVIEEAYQFPEMNDPRNREAAERLASENAVSIHVRKGPDYRRTLNEGICDRDFYVRSVEAVRQRTENPVFYLFSDNPKWCRDNLSFINASVVDWNPGTGPESIRDMQLMSLCKHNIIANSSYSWWGAWLNRNPGKVVIGPKRWFNSDSPKFDTRDIMPESWIRV